MDQSHIRTQRLDGKPFLIERKNQGTIPNKFTIIKPITISS